LIEAIHYKFRITWFIGESRETEPSADKRNREEACAKQAWERRKGCKDTYWKPLSGTLRVESPPRRVDQHLEASLAWRPGAKSAELGDQWAAGRYRPSISPNDLQMRSIRLLDPAELFARFPSVKLPELARKDSDRILVNLVHKQIDPIVVLKAA